MNLSLAFLAREPVAIGAIVAITLNLAITFGLHLSVDQVALINALIVAIIGLAARSASTPIAAPALSAGTEVEVITPGTEPNPTVTLPGGPA